MLCVLLFIYGVCWCVPEGAGQAFKMSQPNAEFGYTILQMDKVQVLENYVKLIDIIDLGEYEHALVQLRHTVEIIHGRIMWDVRFLNSGIDSALEKIHFIGGQNRNKVHKRGLVDLGGKMVKWLFRNMDSEDANEVYGHLDNLDKNTGQMNDQINKQVVINEGLIKGMKNVSESLRQTQEKVEKSINVLGTQTTRALSIAEVMLVALPVYAEIESVNKHLDKILDTITMSQQGIMPHDILTSDEKNLYGITAKMLPLVRLSSLMIGGKVIFVVNLPIETKEVYSAAMIIPFPNENHEEIDFVEQKVLISDENVFEKINKKNGI